ncbi:MAG: transposase [Verrucomicrobia bacterium]|nr:transposase [Verrucomicrobiota bacterium]
MPPPRPKFLVHFTHTVPAETWRDAYRFPGAQSLELHQLYRAMAWLGENQEESSDLEGIPRTTKDEIEEQLFDRRRDLFSEVDLVFFDTTSIYFEGQGGESLGQHGFSKDHRPDLRQLVVGLAVDVQGWPICSLLWLENITDAKSLLPVVQRLRKRFRVRRVAVVADRGMISKALVDSLESEERRCRPTAAILDSQTIRSAGLAVQAGYDGAKKTKGRKLFLLVDTRGHVLGVKVLPADVPERAGAKELLDEVLASSTWLQRLYVDGGFSGPDFVPQVAAIKPSLKMEVVKRTDTQAGFKVVPKRWVVERIFGWLMHCRRLARDYECLPESVAAWIHVTMLRSMLRRMA